MVVRVYVEFLISPLILLLLINKSTYFKVNLNEKVTKKIYTF